MFAFFFIKREDRDNIMVCSNRSMDINGVKHMVAFNGEYQFEERSLWTLRMQMVDKLGDVVADIDVFATFFKSFYIRDWA